MTGNPLKLHLLRLAQSLQSRLSMKTSSAVRFTAVGATTSQKEASEAFATTRPSSADLRLLARLRAGDDSAVSELVRRYHSSLMRLALAFLPNEALAEEAVQDTWAAVLDGLASFEGRSSLKTWIFRILTNRAKTRLVREARSVPFSALAGEDSDEVAVNSGRFAGDGHWAKSPPSFSAENPEKQLIEKEAMSCLDCALQQLPLNQRAVVTLRDVQGTDSDEVCNILGISETNQRVLLHRGRSKLRSALEEHLIGAAPTCSGAMS